MGEPLYPSRDYPGDASSLKVRTVTLILRISLPDPEPQSLSSSSKRTMTPSTPMAPTMSGQNLPLSTDDSFDPSGLRPGNSDAKMLNPMEHSLGQDPENPWISSLPQTKEAPFPNEGSMRPSRLEFGPTATRPYMFLPPATE